MAAYHEGDVWKPKATITNPESETPNAPVEPGSISFTFLSPKGTESTGTPTKISEGIWRSEKELTEAGEWRVSVVTTAPFKASQPASIQVERKFQTQP